MSDGLFRQAYPSALRQARYRARLLRLILRLAQAEEEDFVQDLLLHLWLRLPSFDPSTSSLPTFCDRVMKNKAATIAEGLMAGKRDCRLCCLASQILADVADPLSTKHPTTTKDETEQRDLRLDVNRALESIPAELARVARVLMRESLGDAAQVLRISRATLYRRIEQLRSVFMEASLDHYCANAAIASRPQRQPAPVSDASQSSKGAVSTVSIERGKA